MLADATAEAQRTESETEIALGAVASIAASAQRRASRLASSASRPAIRRPSIGKPVPTDRRERPAPTERSVGAGLRIEGRPSRVDAAEPARGSPCSDDDDMRL